MRRTNELRHRRHRAAVAGAIALASVSLFTACKDEPDNLSEAVEEMGDALEDAGDEIEDALD